MSVLRRRAWTAMACMAAAAAVGQAMVPTRLMASMRGPRRIADMLPATTGDWRAIAVSAGALVNPQTQAMLDRLYSQLVDRVYQHQDGYRIMVSIAYGEDQADNQTQLHYPEVCYPAQGFAIRSNQRGELRLAKGTIRVRRLESVMAESRFEPITYWTIVGNRQVLDGWERKKAEIAHGLQGQIVDGLLFRVSSIDTQSLRAFERQAAFIDSLATTLDTEARSRLMALP